MQDFDGPYRKYPVAVVYHPSSQKYGNAWLNIGFAGWIGVLSGVNEHQLAVSEIGVSYPDASFGKESRFGNPFTFVLRDVLQWDSTLEQSIRRMKTTKRTCNLILGVGDGKSEFRAFQYSHSVCNVIGDTNPLPEGDWHPAVENTVYYGMDWLCPPFHERLGELLKTYHGGITAEVAIRKIVPGLNSGNLQVAVYDLTNERVYFAYGHIDEQGHAVNAYKRPYIGLNLKKLFAHPNA
jgi:isopenicillin-N N-acyltransferase like protein